VSCLKCGSVKLRVISEQDDESGEMNVYLYCPSCRERERLPDAFVQSRLNPLHDDLNVHLRAKIFHHQLNAGNRFVALGDGDFAKLVRLEVFVQLFPALGAVELVALIHIKTFFNFATLLGDLRFDAINFVTNIHTIGNGALMVVFGDEVLVEKADGLFGRRSGETDEKGVEVFEHLPPEPVDGAMAFVGDNEVKHFDGNGGIVGNFLWTAIGGADL
jgi:hypothetical protein